MSNEIGLKKEKRVRKLHQMRSPAEEGLGLSNAGQRLAQGWPHHGQYAARLPFFSWPQLHFLACL